MPVTKTAKRALRGSLQKANINKMIVSKMEIAVRLAKKNPSSEKIMKAISLADRAAKKHAIHKNKAARIKSKLDKISAKQKAGPKKKTSSKK